MFVLFKNEVMEIEKYETISAEIKDAHATRHADKLPESWDECRNIKIFKCVSYFAAGVSLRTK